MYFERSYFPTFYTKSSSINRVIWKGNSIGHMKMNQLKDVINLIWIARGRMLESVMTWTEEQVSFKPSDGAWSASEIFEHLHVVEFKTLQQIW